MTMTVTEIKQELPDVLVEYRGAMYVGRIKGRKLEYAMVWIEVDGCPLSFGFTWRTIARSIDNGSMLRT